MALRAIIKNQVRVESDLCVCMHLSLTHMNSFSDDMATHKD